MAQRTRFNPERDRPLYETLFEPGSRMPRAALILDRLGQALLRTKRAGCYVAVLVLSDIKGATNAADYSDIARTLQSFLHVDETVARGPGDSNLIVICNIVDGNEHAQLVAQRLINGANLECRVDVTLGNAKDEPEELLARAIERAQRHGYTSANDVLVVPWSTQKSMEAMRVVDEMIDYRAQLQGTTDGPRRAELARSMDACAARIKAYLDSVDD